jgi:hypothetical protein
MEENVMITSSRLVRFLLSICIVAGGGTLYHKWAYPPIPICNPTKDEPCPTEEWIREMWEVQKQDGRVHNGWIAKYQMWREKALQARIYLLGREMPPGYHYDFSTGRFTKNQTVLQEKPKP